MRIKKGFVLREVCGEWVVSGESLEQINFNKLVTLNASAVFLWKFSLETGGEPGI